MKEAAKQMREFCQDRIGELLTQKKYDDQTLKTLVTVLHQMHQRLAILEGVDPRKLDRTTF